MALTIGIDGLGIIANADALINDTGGTGTGDWGELGGGTIGTNPDVYLYGSMSIGNQYASKSGYSYFDRGAGNELNFNSGGNCYQQYVYLWINISAKGAFKTKAQKGFTIRMGGELDANYREWLIAGKDDANGWAGGWKLFVIDPTIAGTTGTGSGTLNTGAIRYIGVWIDTDVSVRADSVFLSQIAVGKGIKVTAETSTTGWKDLADYCTDYPNRAWGMMQQREGIYYVYGKISIGHALTQSANVSFTGSGKIIQFGRSEFWSGSAWVTSYPNTANAITVEDHASYTTTLIDGVVVGSDKGRSGSTIIGDSGHNVNIDLYGGNNAASVTECYGTTFKNINGVLNAGNDAQHKFYSCSFLNCKQFDPVGAPEIKNCIFAETTDADAALLWNESIVIENCSFVANATGCGIEMPSNAGDPYTYSALLFSGNDYDVLNSSGYDIEVQKSGGSNPTSYDPAGNVIDFTASFDFVITGLELDTEVTIVTAGTTTVLYHLDAASIPDGEGKYKATYTHSGGGSVDVLIHHFQYKPDISNIYNVTLPNSASSAKVKMFLDENYYNP